MRRGKQGHVAEPRGPTRVPASRGCDVCIFIFTRNLGFTTYKHRIFGFTLTLIFSLRYIPDRSLSFSPCGTMFPSFLLISGRVVKRGALDAI